MTSKPTMTLITTPAPIATARKLAAELGGNFRAPHHTVSRAGLSGEMALAAGGVLLLDEPAEFTRGALSMLESLWAGMDPACRPEILLTVRATDDPKLAASTCKRLGELFEGWIVTEHVSNEHNDLAD